MIRPPVSTTASIEDFRNSGWKVVVCGSGSQDYDSMWRGLCSAAAAATHAGEFSKAKILWLLGDTCSLTIDPSNHNEPLRPFNQFGLESFDDSDIELLDMLCPELDDIFLRARIADILWLRCRPRKVRDALTAIDAYRSTSLDSEDWIQQNTRDCWRRAIMLAIQIKEPGKKILAEMKKSLISATIAEMEDGGAALSMLDVLLTFGLADECFDELAELLRKRAARVLFSENGNRFFLARAFLSRAKLCIDSQEQLADIDCLIAQTYADEAEYRLVGLHPCHIVAASFYADAIKVLLSIPKALRNTRGVEDKLKAYRQKQRETALQSMDDFVPIPCEAIDIGDLCRGACDEVAGKELLEALLILAKCCSLANRELEETAARQKLNASFFGRNFSTQKLSSEGRVIARSPAAGDLSAESKEPPQAVWNKMIEIHQFHIKFGVQASIAPTLQQVLSEHFISSEDLLGIVAQSGVVPAERVSLVVKGLKAGFDGDFIVALHLLVPQLEHLVRFHLKLRGANTVRSDAQNLEMEAGLSTLVELNEMVEVFGADLQFEIRAMFCDGFGPNLRNELAHGLLGTDALLSAESIYAWWLIFRVIFLQYWYRDV